MKTKKILTLSKMKKDENEIIKNILIQCGIGESIVYCDNFISQFTPGNRLLLSGFLYGIMTLL